MSFSTGARLGPYEVVSLPGSGGMGEVYRARDTRLERNVAVKVLPSHLIDTAQARDRFQREARAGLASSERLRDPRRWRHRQRTRFLVMELLQRETLPQRLIRGRLGESDTSVLEAVSVGEDP